MKKFARLSLLFVMLFVVAFGLTACSKITQDKADEVQGMIDEGQKLSVSDVEEILGEATKKSLIVGNGWVIFSALDEEEWNEAVKNGEKVEYISVTFVGGNAISSIYHNAAAEED